MYLVAWRNALFAEIAPRSLVLDDTPVLLISLIDSGVLAALFLLFARSVEIC